VSKRAPKASIYFFAGKCHENCQNIKKAMSFYKDCLKVDKNHIGACVHLARLLTGLRELDRARKYFQHALKIDPESISANYGMGKTLQDSED